MRLLFANELERDGEAEYGASRQHDERKQEKAGYRLRQQRRLPRRSLEAAQSFFPEQACRHSWLVLSGSGFTSSLGTKYTRSGFSCQPNALKRSKSFMRISTCEKP